MTTMLTGVVTAPPSAGMVSVRLPGKTTADLVALGRHITNVTAGDAVLVAVDGSQAWAVMLLGVAAAAPAPAPIDANPPPQTVEQNPTQRGKWSGPPTWTGTWRAGAWRSKVADLYQGDYSGNGLNQGGAFFDALDALGTLLEVRLCYTRGEGAGVNVKQSPTFVLLAGGRSTTAYPTILASAAGTAVAYNEPATWVVPSSWYPPLQDGTAGGIGVSIGTAAPYLKILSSLWAEADWERN